MQEAIEHRRREYTVAGEGGIPAAKSKVRSEDHGAVFVTAGHHLKEQIGLLAAHWQIANLVDDEKLVSVDRAMHHFAITALALGGFEHQHQVGRTEEAGFVTTLGGKVT